MRGKDREVGRTSAKQPYRLARSRAVPKGRPEAKRSGPPRSWECRKDARPSAPERLVLPCSQATGTGKAGWSVLAIERDGNQHTMGTLGESETGNAWDWGLTDIHVS